MKDQAVLIGVTGMSLDENPGAACGGICAIYAIIACVIWIPLAFWTDRNMDFWLSHFKGETVDISWWLSLLLSIFAPFAIFANVVAEIARVVI